MPFGRRGATSETPAFKKSRMALKLSSRESACSVKSEGFLWGNLGHLGGGILHLSVSVSSVSVLKSKVQEVQEVKVKM